MTSFTNKFAIVTGGGRDIGQATVVELARGGADVAFTHFGTAPDSTLKLAGNFERKITAHSVDVTSSSAINEFISRVAANRKIDLLVNVAGGLVARKKMEEMDEAFWDNVISLNLKSTFLFTKAALPHMNDGGAIVNFSSQAGRDGGGPGAIAYATAKGAIMTFTRGLAKELGPRKIRVNAVCPGMINTTFHNTFTKPEVRQRVAGMTPLGREGESAEVAKLVAYLASDGGSFVNGACIDINGGIAFS
jgi:3-oxoacyl-[acyl-carrier protein] reductase